MEWLVTGLVEKAMFCTTNTEIINCSFYLVIQQGNQSVPATSVH